MQIRNIHDATLQPVEMDGVSRAKMAVMVGQEDRAPNFACRVFHVEPGGHTPRHSHDFEHEVYVVDGEGTVLKEGQEHPIRGGDVLYIPAEEEHQFRGTGDAGLRFLCMVPMSRACGEATPGT